MRTLNRISGIVAALAAVFIAGCGGGGGTSTATATSPSPTSATSITSYFVDGPTQGLTYACSPSGLTGVTSVSGGFVCQAGDSVTFSLSVGSGSITLGTVKVPSISGASLPVTAFANGLQIAEILQALNHGSSTNLDVGGLSIPSALVADINNYIASGGTLPAGQTSDDQFLAYLQSQTTGTTSFVSPVSGTGKTFLETTVLPNLQTMIAGISATNPPPVVSNGVTNLNGSILVSGTGTIQTPNCTPGTVTATGGGILNAVVEGDIQQPGAYAATFTSPGFLETITTSSFTCTVAGTPNMVAGTSTTMNVPPINGKGTITVTTASNANTLSIATPNYTPPAGCTGGGAISGTDIGLSNPLITMTTSVTCAPQSGASVTVSATAKLVGAP